MRKFLLAAFAVMFTTIVGASPLWLRYNAISPAGDKIAFTYKGDIYTVSANGGEAKQLTTSQSYEYMPIWSPDGQKIAFASDRNGNFDIYVVSIEGGEATRLTTNSSPELPRQFSTDGKEVYYSAAIQKPFESVQFASGWITELWKVSINGGRPSQVVPVPVMNMSFAKDGKSFIYENRTGSENEWRKHHVSSVARDLFYYDAAKQTHTWLTKNVGENRNPIFTPDGKVVFLSERNGGSFNVYKADMNDIENVTAVTSFKKHPVRFLSQSQDGTLCYGYQGEIYTQKVGGKAQKLAVTIKNDNPQDQIKTMTFRSGEEYAITPDGSQIAVVVRGEVFATTDEFPTTKQISKTASAERGVTISPDGRTIAYASERSGVWAIYTAKIVRNEEVNFANATLIEETPLFGDEKVERFAPQFSPDGKEIAFIEDRQFLKVINLETKKVRQITDGSKHHDNDDWGFNFNWSPNGKWFAMEVITNVRDPYSDIAIVSAVDGGKIYNITNSAYIDHSPRWVLDGNAIIYTSNRLGMRAHASWGSQNDVFIAFLNQESYDKFRMSEEELNLMKEAEKLAKKSEKKDEAKSDKKDEVKKEESKEIFIDLEKLEDRIVRITPMSSNLGGAILSKDGETLYFLAAYEKTFDLWKVSLRERSVSLFKKGIGYGALELSKDGKTLFVLGGRAQKISLASGKSTPISMKATMDMNVTQEREYMFNHVFKQQTKRFYNTTYHGIDLVQLRKDYLPFLPHVNNNYDFSEMLSEILGELNVSHTGSGYRPSAKNGADNTADLGLLYDFNYTGNGLKVGEVLSYGPFDVKTSKVKAGDIIIKVNGVEIKAGEDYFPIFNKLVGKNTLVTIMNPTTKATWEEVVKPISKGMTSELMYKRWIKTRAEETEKLSNGRLGYVHIRSMGDASYRDVYADILGRYNQCDGIVIDTRYNGGGRLHEDIEILFSGQKYLEQVIRGRVSCDMPSRRYNNPSIMITCEANYSNAHGTPWVYRFKKMGSIVGMPVPGTMTSVNWETLQDASMYFGIPVIGYRTQQGEYLENSQLEPDFLVVNTPEKVSKGTDEQLEKAVKELLKQVDAKPRW